MSYSDQLADMRSDLFYKVVDSFLSQPDTKVFELWKEIVLIQNDLYSLSNMLDADELICMAILDDFHLFDRLYPISVTADELAGFMLIYPEFRYYCDLQLSGDGLLACIKYRHQLVHGLDLIRKALEIAK